MNRPLQQAPYLREQRKFPHSDIKDLSEQVDLAYIDIASKVNKRIISTFGTGFQIITGENWFLSGSSNKQQTLREVYSFSSTSSISHGLGFDSISKFTRCWGTFTDGTNWYGLPFGTSTAIAGQITFYVSSSQIIFSVGAGAPTLTDGLIILEWLSDF